MTSAVGLLLAAGAGRRMGTPKALVRDPDGTSWLHRSLDTLRSGGCSRVVLVLGAAHDRAAAVLAEDPRAGDVEVVVATDWDEGMGASLRAGLRHLGSHRGAPSCGTAGTVVAEVAVVTLVDLPDVGPDVVRRLLAVVGASDEAGSTLARAAYRGVAGHPVVLGSDHWAAVVAVAA
ncbi:MAG: NTP transferase domain-containing protein, partial [Actinomycetota bacterium]|nr:NTP transferase domain-containing protein [Actinomycetota bacterium]